MNGWGAQKYGYVPLLVNVKRKLSPGARFPEFHTCVSEVVV